MSSSIDSIIREIAMSIDGLTDVYYSPTTQEIVYIPTPSILFDEDEFYEDFKEDLEKVTNQDNDFIKFEAIRGRESFNIMERFTEQVDDLRLQAKLEYSLDNKKPFQHFKHVIDHSDYRQKWFDFKQSELEIIVRRQLENEPLD